MDGKQERLHWFLKFTFACVVIAFIPMIILIVCSPVFYLFGCKGGATFHCNYPSMNNFAESVTAIGAWGCFFTIPITLGIWCIVGGILLFVKIFNPQDKNDGYR